MLLEGVGIYAIRSLQYSYLIYLLVICPRAVVQLELVTQLSGSTSQTLFLQSN